MALHYQIKHLYCRFRHTHSTYLLKMMQDKGYKLSMIGKRIREYGGGYTMIVDADDLVSCRIAEYVNKPPGCNGFVSKYGYIYIPGFARHSNLIMSAAPA